MEPVGHLPKPGLQVHARGGGAVVTGLFATNSHQRSRVGGNSLGGLGWCLYKDGPHG